MNSPTPAEPLLSVEDLTVSFAVDGRGARRSTLTAVDGVSFDIRRGETLGLVGESGCGKSTTGRGVLQLVRPASGTVTFDGTDLTGLSGDALRQIRRRMQMVFQDPLSSLNPRMTVGETVEDPLLVHGMRRGDQRRRRVRDLFDMVGLPEAWIDRYPHELSGGQRQRIGIARALVTDPDFIVADEPVSALDVSIQAQTINLLESLQEQLGLTYLFIAHDLAVVRHTSTRIAVMYLGKIVEIASADELCETPRHPYTQALLSAVPIPSPEVEAERERIILTGDVPSPVDPPSGCRFRTRCWRAEAVCAEVDPAMTLAAGDHEVACHFPLTEH